VPAVSLCGGVNGFGRERLGEDLLQMPLTTTNARLIVPSAAAAFVALTVSASAQNEPRAWYSAEQAASGALQARTNCEPCHGAGLLGGDAPALSGPELFANWPTAHSIYEFFSVEMPPFNPGGLGEEAYVEILAYILSLNGYPAGSDALTADPAILEEIRLQPQAP
jgi:quinoprotein glucose dehydrogenase